MSLWIIIAKNEIKIKTAKFRAHRNLSFVIIYVIFIFWATYLGPVIFDVILPDILLALSGTLEFVLQFVIEVSLTTMFVMMILYPIFLLFRKSEIGVKDVILSSPVKSADILLGEFVGQLPFHFLIVLAIGPAVVSLLGQVNPQLTILHYLIIYLVIFLMMNFSLIIGTILANYIELKLSTSKRIKDSINSVLLLLSFIVIISFYLFHYIFNIGYDNPVFKNWMSIFPSFWYSNIILYLVNPSLIESYIINIWLSVVFAIGIPMVLIYFSYKKADKFYSIDIQSEKKLLIVKTEGFILKIIKKMTLKKYKVLIMVQFKNFLRRKENITKLIYSIAFTGVLGLFIFLSLDNPITEIKEFSLLGIVSIPVEYFSVLVIFIIAWMGGLIFGMMMGISVIFNSKNILYLYKKSIRGIRASIFTFLYQMVFLILFFDIILTVFFALLFALNIYSVGFFFCIYFIYCFIVLIQVVGLQCIRPFFDERGKQIYFKIYFIFVLQFISLLISLFINIPLLPVVVDYSLGFLFILLTNIGISSIIAFLMLSIGIFKLNRTD